MRLPSILPIFSILLLTTNVVSQDVFHVDPNIGHDNRLASGDATEPFKTITYAVARSAPGNSLEVLCHDGSFRRETWPIQVGLGNMTIRAINPGAVLIEPGATAGAAMSNFDLSPASGDLTLHGLTVTGAQKFVRVIGGGSSGHHVNVKMEQVTVAAGTLIHVKLSGNARLNFDLRLSDVRAADSALTILAEDQAHIKVNVQRSRLHGGSDHGIHAEAIGPDAQLVLNVENTVISNFGQHGIQVIGGGGPCDLTMNSCNLVGNGVSIPGKAAVSLVTPDPISQYPHANLFRNIFHANGGDIQDFALMPGNFSFETNLLQDTAADGIGGNIVGDPDFVGTTMIMGANSLAVGTAPLGGLGHDFNGNLRALDGRGDIGAFEHVPYNFGVDGQAFLGRTLGLAMSGPPGHTFALLAGWERSFGTTLGIVPMAGGNPGVIGQLDLNGKWTTDFRLPAKSWLAGNTVYFQAVGRLENGNNSLSQVVEITPTFSP